MTLRDNPLGVVSFACTWLISRRGTSLDSRSSLYSAMAGACDGIGMNWGGGLRLTVVHTSILPLGHVMPELLPQLPPTVRSVLSVAADMRRRPAVVLANSVMIRALHNQE